MRKLYFEEADKCTYRAPTKLERAEAIRSEKLRKKMIKQRDEAERELDRLAKHPLRVFYDEPGMPYDVRVFIASGKTELI
jgi:hypothetical protein